MRTVLKSFLAIMLVLKVLPAFAEEEGESPLIEFEDPDHGRSRCHGGES